MRELYPKYGYEEVVTPQVFDVELFKKSGHYQNYHENMFFTEVDEREFGVKPMNCPGHFLMFSQQAFSYRDLPVRYADFGRLHRYERSGVTQGLTRVRTFCQDDSHIFVTLDQMAAEMDRFIELIDEVYGAFGFTDVKVGLATRPEKFMGTVENWDIAEKALASAFERRGRPYVIHAGDGAFYGPKLDFQVTDAIGRAWQLGTLQVDFSNPEQFDLHYTAEDGSKKRPVVLHRAVLGSLERFFGILIEHTGGDFPLWLAPEQARVIPVSDKLLDYARTVADALRAAGLRVTVDERNEKLGAKIRNGELEKVPVLLVVGEKEREAGAVSVRQAPRGRPRVAAPRRSRLGDETGRRRACGDVGRPGARQTENVVVTNRRKRHFLSRRSTDSPPEELPDQRVHPSFSRGAAHRRGRRAARGRQPPGRAREGA